MDMADERSLGSNRSHGGGADDTTHTSAQSHTRSGTYLTEVPGGAMAKQIDLRLPNGYNVVAVRETLLSEASFVTRSSRGFWRRMMDNPQFVTMFTAGFHHILECVSESGMILVEKLTSAGPDNALVSIMSATLADMYYTFQRSERDIFLPRLPELICFMIVNALQAAVPKHQRIYNSTKFRELIIDWASELVGGIRAINCRAGREWFFADALDMPVMISNAGRASLAVMTMNATLAKRTAAVLPLNSVGSRYNLDHSPLVGMYIDKYNPSLAAATARNVLHITLSHHPDRPLLTLQEGLVKTVKFREKKVDLEEVKGYRREVALKRTRIMKEYDVQKALAVGDVQHLKDGLKAQIAMLQGKKVSNKHLLAAAVVTGGK